MSQDQYFSSNFKLGILGGGQLGKMLLYETLRYDIYTKVMDPNENAPCQNICNEFVIGDLTDYDDVVRFGEKIDVITIEIENVNTNALEYLESQGKKVFPSSKTLRIIQNKSLQKIFTVKIIYQHLIIKITLIWIRLKNDLKNNVITLPAVWKSAKFGYDGKGVKILNTFADLNNLPNVACLIEEKVSISKEISVIVARNQKSQEAYFPVVEMEFNPDSNLVEYIMCPAVISNEIQEKAIKIALETAKKMNCIGLLAVELFITKKIMS